MLSLLIGLKKDEKSVLWYQYTVWNEICSKWVFPHINSSRDANTTSSSAVTSLAVIKITAYLMSFLLTSNRDWSGGVQVLGNFSEESIGNNFNLWNKHHIEFTIYLNARVHLFNDIPFFEKVAYKKPQYTFLVIHYKNQYNLDTFYLLSTRNVSVERSVIFSVKNKISNENFKILVVKYYPGFFCYWHWIQFKI